MLSKTINPILLVEDNPLDVDLTLRALSVKKFINPIQVARDGEEALDCIKQWELGKTTPFLILLDINMPKISGLEVLEVIKSHPKYKIIPIVILTTSNDSSDIQTAYQLGANSYIIKPVDFDKFAETAVQLVKYWKELNKCA